MRKFNKEICPFVSFKGSSLLSVNPIPRESYKITGTIYYE